MSCVSTRDAHGRNPGRRCACRGFLLDGCGHPRGAGYVAGNFWFSPCPLLPHAPAPIQVAAYWCVMDQAGAPSIRSPCGQSKRLRQSALVVASARPCAKLCGRLIRIVRTAASCSTSMPKERGRGITSSRCRRVGLKMSATPRCCAPSATTSKVRPNAFVPSAARGGRGGSKVHHLPPDTDLSPRFLRAQVLGGGVLPRPMRLRGTL